MFLSNNRNRICPTNLNCSYNNNCYNQLDRLDRYYCHMTLIAQYDRHANGPCDPKYFTENQNINQSSYDIMLSFKLAKICYPISADRYTIIAIMQLKLSFSLPKLVFPN